MKVELRPVDDRNREACIRLKVKPEQAEFVASNERSLMQAAEKPEIARPFAIYADDHLVGFTMFAFDDFEDEDGYYHWLWRFMIDSAHQGKGYGKAAMKEIIEYFKENGAKTVALSTEAHNSSAIALYESFGFRKTGQVIDGETVFLLEFGKAWKNE